MKITFCEVPDDRKLFPHFWDSLKAHVKENGSDIVLLNEFCFIPWFGRKDITQSDWDVAITASAEWESRLHEIGAPVVISSRPIYNQHDSKRHNQGFVWTKEGGVQGKHLKNFLPEEDNFWEASWYSRGNGEFKSVALHNVGTSDVTFGFMMCSEMWFPEYGRTLGKKEGVQIIVVPRATEAGSLATWLIGGQALAVISGAFVVSSNRVGNAFGGMGWLVDPDGKVLAKTDSTNPIVTHEINLDLATKAKSTYPRYIPTFN